MNHSARPLALAAMLIGGTVAAAAPLAPATRTVAVGMLVAAIAAIYVGFALRSDDQRFVAIEIAVAAVVAVLALVGVQRPWILVALLLAHGIWDLAHTPHHITTTVPTGYPTVCAAYDIALAAAAATGLTLGWLA